MNDRDINLTKDIFYHILSFMGAFLGVLCFFRIVTQGYFRAYEPNPIIALTEFLLFVIYLIWTLAKIRTTILKT